MELVINTQNFNQKDFSWNTDYTFTLNREKITELADGTDRDISNGWFVGHSIKTHYGLEKSVFGSLTRPRKQLSMVRSRDV